MFIVRIAAYGDIEAEFVVPDAIVALDLALRADRAGFLWHVADARVDKRPLTLTLLREIADAHARAEPARADYLTDVVMADSTACAARLN